MSARFYIVTGKGGVGKTIVSLALTRYLQGQNINACYTSINCDEIALAGALEVNSFFLAPKDSAKLYMSRKLNSETIASWISKTPFFESIFNMLPGFSDLIFLGHLIHKLQNNDDLVIVLDSPATGHALGLIESPKNFKDIFGTGPIVKDIEDLYNFLATPGNLETIILTLPNSMSFQEGLELQNELNNGSAQIHSKLVLNEMFSLHKSLKNPAEDLPPYLSQKLLAEEDIIKELNKNSKTEQVLLPYISRNDPLQVIKELTLLMERLA